MLRKLILMFCLLTFACTQTPASTPAPTISGTDAELDAAIAQARASLKTFTDTIATPHADRTYVAVKVHFSPPNEFPQDIWVDDVTYTDGVFRGNIGDDIPSMKLEVGERITIDEKDILDWMIVQDGKLIGGYTIRLAIRRMSADERERFFATLDYEIED
jgi:uncharacterized protein YegJ (DUF2314 family)